jgi:hypothetical protein
MATKAQIAAQNAAKRDAATAKNAASQGAARTAGATKAATPPPVKRITPTPKVDPIQDLLAKQKAKINEARTFFDENAAGSGDTETKQRTELRRTPVFDGKGKVIGYNVTYSDGTSEFIENPGYQADEEKETKTLARDTFMNTLALIMGDAEAGQPWVNELYDLMQGFVNTGSTVEEAQNLALREAKKQGKASKFVQRFDAIFKLQDRLNAGEAVQVPSIADYVKSEQQLGDVFRAVGLGELATQQIAGKILGDANKSVAEATSLISDVFGAIDNAPDVLKNDLKTYFPGADRTSIAKAILLGKEGAVELTKKVKGIEQLSAAKSQGVTIDLATGTNLALGGADYGTSLDRFGTVKRLERGQMLGRMSNIDFTQQEAIDATFSQNVKAQDKINKIAEEEMNRFSGRSGRLASQNRSSAGLI